MLRAYLDDSGSDSISEYFILAGWVAPAPAWESFTDDWRSALMLSPQIAYVKSKEVYGTRGEFLGWGKMELSGRLAIFGNIVRKHVIAGGGAAVRKQDYEDIIRGNINKRFDSPYFVCFVSVVTILVKHLDALGFTDKMDFVFDEDTIKRKVGPLFDGFKEWPWEFSDRLGSLDYRSDKEVPPLQAADLVAGLARRQLRKLASSETRELTIGPHPNVHIQIVGRPELQKMREVGRLTRARRGQSIREMREQ
jgi:hypothetical protein